MLQNNHRMAARLPRIGDFLCVICLLSGWTVRLVSPQFDPRLICDYIPGLNQAQRNVCKEVPEAMVTLTTAEDVFKGECEWQFKKDRWNCSDVEPPIFKDPELQETKESAFVYALTSAITVHQITKACSIGNLSTCTCDTSMNGVRTIQGWEWGSCSDNINYGVSYAQRFLDQREHNLDSVPAPSDQDIARALVHFHNNAAGRRVVQDNMKLTCRCHGFSGSCSIKTCWRELPTIFEIGDTVKEKYDKAIKVDMYRPRNGGSARLQYYDEEVQQFKQPLSSKLVYLRDSEDFCSMEGNYTHKRYCIPKENLTDTHAEYYSPCENFCCTGDYYSEQKTILRSCNCKFIWCCQVVCQTCSETVTQFRCSG